MLSHDIITFAVNRDPQFYLFILYLRNIENCNCIKNTISLDFVTDNYFINVYVGVTVRGSGIN